jgi:hypothetical protein
MRDPESDPCSVRGIAGRERSGRTPHAQRRIDMYLIAFPLLLIPFALYNMVAFLLSMEFEERLFSIPLLSDARMPVNTGDMLIILGIMLLYIEVLKATRLSSKAIMDHVLSFVLFIVMVAEFIAVERAATATFLILTVLCFFDVIAGFTTSARTAQRDISLEHPERFASGG